MNPRRVTLFAGHYGSGKTNIAVNYALRLAGQGLPVTVADMDIVNPYFRTKDSADVLARAGVRLVSSAYANTNVDTPALPGDLYTVTADRTRYAVLDVGGDDRGALALGRYAPAIIEEGDYDMLLVVNRFRPLTRDAEGVAEIIEEIGQVCSLPFTGFVDNSNLGAETTAEDVLDSEDYRRQITKKTGLPLRFVTVREDLAPALADKIPCLLPLRLQAKIIDDYSQKKGTTL